MKLRNLSAAGVILAIGLATPARANDSNYQLTFVNNTPMTVWVTYVYSFCQSWDGSTPNWPITVQPYTSSTPVTFYRASNCSGKNGSLILYATEGWGSAYGTAFGPLSMNFTANGQMNVTIQQGGWLDAVPDYTFLPYVTPDQSTITFTIRNKDQVNLQTALGGGCWSPADADNMVGTLAAYSDSGSVTTSKAQQYSTASYTSRLRVTLPIWGFRALTFTTKEADAMENGTLLSKMAYSLSKLSTADRAALWKRGGPRINGSDSGTALPFRLLALSSSDTPRSQTVSVALDYATAAPFRQIDPYVYAFEFIPDSEVLGMQTCGSVQSGEVQVQPLGGTPVWNLMRSRDGVTWESWTGSNWTPSTVVPSNGNLFQTRVPTRAGDRKQRPLPHKH